MDLDSNMLNGYLLLDCIILFITSLYHILSPSFYFRIRRMAALVLVIDNQPPGHDVDEA